MDFLIPIRRELLSIEWSTEQQKKPKKSDKTTDIHLLFSAMNANRLNNRTEVSGASMALTNRPNTKLPPRPKSTYADPSFPPSPCLATHASLTSHPDSRVNKRPISRTQALQRGSHSSSTASNPKQRVIYVGNKSPFMSIVSRARKALENGPAGVHANSSSKGLPLAARVAALSTNPAAEGDGEGEEVLIRGTGRAMAKTLEVAAWFTRQADVRVSLRTMTLEAVDDVVVDEDEAEAEGGFAAEEETRVRMVNCLEVGVSLR